MRSAAVRVCFHGAESTGKSLLAKKLADEFGCPLVGEYGRTYAETIDTNFRIADLTAIAAKQNRLMREASSGNPPLVLLDTDPLMTAAWAEMMFGHAPNVLFGYDKAECYLLFEPDVPFVEDGTRFFGTEPERARFAALAEDMLVRAGVGFVRVGGRWEKREEKARAAIKAALETAGV
jgi:NadR type nicotinamide-nucleotide adenylyltransferase